MSVDVYIGMGHKAFFLGMTKNIEFTRYARDEVALSIQFFV